MNNRRRMCVIIDGGVTVLFFKLTCMIKMEIATMFSPEV